jgi:hypothetical protein
MRTLLADPAYTHVGIDRLTAPLREECWTGGLGALVQLYAAHMDATGGTLLLTADAVRRLGDIPDDWHTATTAPPAAGERSCARWSPWMIYAQHRVRGSAASASVYVGVIPWMDSGERAEHRGWDEDLAAHLDRWRQVTGAPWVGAPGLAGTVLLSTVTRYRPDPHAALTAPRFKLRRPVNEAVGDAWGRAEPEYQWTTRVPGTGRHRHVYDVRRQWLTAAQSAVVSPERELTRTGANAPVGPRVSGLYLIEPSPWQHPHLPDPLRRRDPADESRVWVAAPTVHLLDSLTQRGMYAGYAVADSYTAPGSELLRPWVKALRAAIEDEHLAAAAKGVYARTLSHIRDGRTRSVDRPDWAATVLGLAQANCFRTVLAIADRTGVAPVRVSKDAITYAADTPDAAACAAGLGIDLADTRLGKLKWERSYRMDERGRRVDVVRPEQRDAVKEAGK